LGYQWPRLLFAACAHRPLENDARKSMPRLDHRVHDVGHVAKRAGTILDISFCT